MVGSSRKTTSGPPEVGVRVRGRARVRNDRKAGPAFPVATRHPSRKSSVEKHPAIHCSQPHTSTRLNTQFRSALRPTAGEALRCLNLSLCCMVVCLPPILPPILPPSLPYLILYGCLSLPPSLHPSLPPSLLLSLPLFPTPHLLPTQHPSLSISLLYKPRCYECRVARAPTRTRTRAQTHTPRRLRTLARARVHTHTHTPMSATATDSRRRIPPEKAPAQRPAASLSRTWRRRRQRGLDGTPRPAPPPVRALAREASSRERRAAFPRERNQVWVSGRVRTNGRVFVNISVRMFRRRACLLRNMRTLFARQFALTSVPP